MKMRLKAMIARPGPLTEIHDGRWVNCVPLPFVGGLFDRMRDAWSVLRGETFAVYWPEAGDLEDALGIPKEKCVRPSFGKRP